MLLKQTEIFEWIEETNAEHFDKNNIINKLGFCISIFRIMEIIMISTSVSINLLKLFQNDSQRRIPSLSPLYGQCGFQNCFLMTVMTISFVGVYIYGLFLDGAGWDRRNCRLVEPTPKVLYTPLPVAHVFATNVDKPSKATNLYECPVYKKPRRTDLTYIFPLLLKTNKNPDHWILRGVALLCDIK